MPLYDVRCHAGCGVREVLCRADEKPPCPTCGALATRCVSAPARTGFRWGGDKGYFDRGLGRYIANNAERERVMKKRGLIDGSDYTSQQWDTNIEGRYAKEAPHDATPNPARGAELIRRAREHAQRKA